MHWLLLIKNTKNNGLMFFLMALFFQNTVLADEYWIVDNLMAISLPSQSDTENVFPWDDLTSRQKKEGLVLSVLDGNGFMEVKYSGYRLVRTSDVEKQKKIVFPVKQMMGRDGFREAYDRAAVLVLRRFKGRDYVVNSAWLYRDFDGRYFIASKDFINGQKLNEKSQNIKFSFNESSCESAYFMSDKKIKMITANNYGEVVDGSKTPSGEDFICYNHGVFLTDLISNYVNQEVRLH